MFHNLEDKHAFRKGKRGLGDWMDTDLSCSFPHLLFSLPYCLISVQQQNAQHVQIAEQLHCSQTEYRPRASAATKEKQTGNPTSRQWPLQG